MKMRSYLLVQEEIKEDIIKLQELGLTEEEIEGFLEFYFDEYFPDEKSIIIN